MKYSIILPVRNGGHYLKECVASILSQEHKDFNLIVLDNCSTDGTTEWIASFPDPRIVLHRSEKSLSIEENWSRITTVSKNEFITLIGHDDILAPNYLSVMDAIIADYPDASLYQTHFSFIDSAGKKIRSCKPMTEVEIAAGFLKNFLQNKIDVMGTGFMMRSVDYDRIGGIPARYPNLLFADFELFLKLTMKSYKATSKTECFSFRLHQSTTSTSPDIKMHKAFEIFIYFLSQLTTEDKNWKEIIQQYGLNFIKAYCKGLAHRLLRTPKNKRDELSVALFLQKCKNYADMLIPGNNFDPRSIPSVRLAAALDRSALGRNAFLFFKKLYRKPVLK